ncbi:MAG: hypothetical protein U1E15_09515 [Hyphomicrobiales bacterium]
MTSNDPNRVPDRETMRNRMDTTGGGVIAIVAAVVLIIVVGLVMLNRTSTTTPVPSGSSTSSSSQSTTPPPTPETPAPAPARAPETAPPAPATPESPPAAIRQQPIPRPQIRNSRTQYEMKARRLCGVPLAFRCGTFVAVQAACAGSAAGPHSSPDVTPGTRTMALEELKAQIAYLLTSIEDNPEDLPELHEMIRQKLSQIRALGLPLPADLVELEQKLEADIEGRQI